MAMAAGDALIAAKERVAHGEWERFCRQECGLSVRLCQTYMELARNRAAIEAKAQRLRFLLTPHSVSFASLKELRAKLPKTAPDRMRSHPQRYWPR
jgi:hypothetical protein